MRSTKVRLTAMALLALAGLSACRTIAATVIVGTAAVVGSVYYVGYGVYKGGEAIVSTVGDAGSAVGGAVSGGYDSVVISQGTFRSTSKYSIAELFPAAGTVFKDAGFLRIGGKYDSLSGEKTAKTSQGHHVSVKFELLREGATAVVILIGEGNLKHSEFIFDRMLATVGDSMEKGK